MRTNSAKPCRWGAAAAIGALALVVAIPGLVLSQGGVKAQGSFEPEADVGLSDYDSDVNADITTSFSLPVTDYNYKELVSFTPEEFLVAAEGDMPLGGVVGELDYLLTLGLLNGACNTSLPPAFDLLWASTDTSDTCTFSEQFDDSSVPGLKKGAVHYPDFLARILPAITPRARLWGWVNLTGVDFSINVVILEPGELPGYPAAWGYPSVTVLNDIGDPGAVPTAGDAITDFCTPRSEDSVIYGLSQDNPATVPDEAGYEVRRNPHYGGTYTFRWHTESYRDTEGEGDGDGIENPLDTCPFDANVDPSPKESTGHSDNDGIDGACEIPLGGEAMDCWPGAPGLPYVTDCDDDGFYNRGDNCPLLANPDQADFDADDIGDDCDVHPAIPDGVPIEWTEEIDVSINGPAPTPSPPVGGIAELAGASGSAWRTYTAIAGLAAPAVVILILSASYARRRWGR